MVTRLRRDLGAKWFNHTTHESSYVFDSTRCTEDVSSSLREHPPSARLRDPVIRWFKIADSLAVWRNDTMDFGTCCHYWCLIRLNRFSIYVMCWRGMIVYLDIILTAILAIMDWMCRQHVRVDHLYSTEWNELHQPKTAPSAWSVRCWRRAPRVKMEYGVNRSWWEWAFTSRRCNFAWYDASGNWWFVLGMYQRNLQHLANHTEPNTQWFDPSKCEGASVKSTHKVEKNSWFCCRVKSILR